MEEIKVNTALAIVLIAFAVIILAGLVVIPALQEAQAISSTSVDRRFGQQGDSSSGGKRQGSGLCGSCG